MDMQIGIVLMPVFWPNLPPVGPASLKGFLRGRGIGCRVLDLNNRLFNLAPGSLKKEWRKNRNTILDENILEKFSENIDPILDELLSFEILGFSCFKSNFKSTLKIDEILKNKKPEIKIILGGPEITGEYFRLGENIVNEYGAFADHFIVGEGELSFFQYLTVPEKSGRISVFNEIKELSELPTPDYSDFSFADYPKKGSVSMLASRGCIRKCKFCSERLLYKTFRTYPVENIIEQIKSHKKNGISNFVFHNSLINGDLTHLEKLCDKIIENFSRVNWEAQIGIRTDMPDRLFAKLKKSGCYNLFIGLESGSDKTLKAMNKGFNTQEALAFFRNLEKHSLNFGVSIITGFPGETEADFDESLAFLIENRDLIPKIEQVNPFLYYEGTPLPREADYKFRPEIIGKTAEFLEKLKQAGYKYTNAFLFNLVEKELRPVSRPT